MTPTPTGWAATELFGSSATFDRVKQVVAEAFGVDPKHIVAKDRLPLFETARLVAHYLARVECKASYPQIGLAFDRTSTGVLQNVKSFEGRLAKDDVLRGVVERLRAEVRGG